MIAAIVAAFVASSPWYSPLTFGKQLLELSGAGLNPDHAGAKIAGEILVLGLGALLWIGFPVLLLSGSVMWQNVPWMLAVIHAGDWFVKLLLMTAILGFIRERTKAKALAQKPA